MPAPRPRTPNDNCCVGGVIHAANPVPQKERPDLERLAQVNLDGQVRTIGSMIPAGAIPRGFTLTIHCPVVLMKDSLGNVTEIRDNVRASDISDGTDCLDPEICFDATNGEATITVKYVDTP